MSHPALDAFGDLAEAARDPHVAGCTKCQTELATQQQIHDLLTSLPDPGPIPPDVVHRIESTLRELASGAHSPESSTVTSHLATPADDTADDTTGEPTTSAATVVPLQSAPSARRRRPLLVAAAAALVLVGGGAVASQLVPSGADGASSSAGAAMQDKGASDSSGEAAVQALASGTAYTRAKLAQQVQDQLAVAPAKSAAAPQGLLATPQGVAGCLSALGAPNVTPLMVDVATFEGKPAAVLVLPAEGGGREIWVVSTSCRPEQDGMKYFTTVR